jgi:hypothetical protein
MSGYCTRADVLAALPSGGLPNPAREVTADATSDVFVCEGHGLTERRGHLPRAHRRDELGPRRPLAEGTTYYAIVVSTSRFQVSRPRAGRRST